MGDLILSYPLMIWLARRYPGHPIFVAAEEGFYKPLMKISPAATYFPWAGSSILKQHKYELVINLSIQEKAAQLAHAVKAERKIGLVQSEDGSRFVHGDWQLYRTSLVRNNRYNRFHWADLNALDVIPPEDMAGTQFETPRTISEKTKIGVFIGASEKAKRPNARFQASLLRELLMRGMHPVLFGGPAEVELGKKIVKLAKAPVLNMCGKLGLDEFAAVGQTLSLFITPDTGPMHLAAWTGLKTLNLSMGPVNPWETGPYQPEHFVLRSEMDCAKGCWHCTRSRLHCHDPFDPARIASLAVRIAAGDPRDKVGKMRLPGLTFFQTATWDGFYNLRLVGRTGLDESMRLSRLWQTFFGYRFGIWGTRRLKGSWQTLSNEHPEAAETLLGHLPEISRQFAHGLRTGHLHDETFWAESPAVVKPLTGFVHMALENGDYSKVAWASAVEHLESLIDCCK